jgi:hypothetical protein
MSDSAPTEPRPVRLRSPFDGLPFWWRYDGNPPTLETLVERGYVLLDADDQPAADKPKPRKDVPRG